MTLKSKASRTNAGTPAQGSKAPKTTAFSRFCGDVGKALADPHTSAVALRTQVPEAGLVLRPTNKKPSKSED